MRVRGVGPVPASVMLIGEAPGREEDQKGVPFIGKSGKELTRFLRTSRLYRDNVYITNLVKERPGPNNEDPEPWMVERDEGELIGEIGRVNPYIIGAVGRFAAHWLLGERFHSMDLQHGITFRVDLPYTRRGWAVVVPVYHPAAGLYAPSKLGMTQHDLHRIAAILRGEESDEELQDAYPDPLYLDLQTPDDVARHLTSRWAAAPGPVFVDTEGWPGRVWGVQVSLRPGEGYLVRVASPEALRAILTFLDTVQKAGHPLVFHRAPHDIGILRELGLEVSVFEDTMLMAYLLCEDRQSLKEQVRRHCGMEMMEYREITFEAGRRIGLEYVEKALERKCARCEGEGDVIGFSPKKKVPRVEKCSDCKGYGDGWGPGPTPKSWTMGRYLKGLRELRDQPTADVRQKWEGIEEDRRSAIERALGPMPEPTLDQIPLTTAITYSCRDTDATCRLARHHWQRMSDMELEQVYDIDLGALPMIERMMWVGMKVDVPYLDQLGAQLREDEARMLGEMVELCGKKDFNPASPDQCADILFKHYQLPVIELTDADKASTRSAVLEELKMSLALKEDAHSQGALQFLKLLTSHREVSKLRGTYTDALPAHVDRHSRIHTEFQYTRTASGRLASRNPNLQNIPTRTKLGSLIRRAFVAKEGHVLYSADLSQIEMRLMAHLSGDEAMIAAIRAGRCLHCQTAVMIFPQAGGDYDAFYQRYKADDPEAYRLRSSSKNVGFGIVYEITEIGLTAQMKLRGEDVTEEEVRKWIQRYKYEAYPGIGRFIDARHSEAIRTGMVRDMFGRIRPFPGAGSELRWVQSASLREATNHPVQSGAQGLIKLAMASIMRQVLPAMWRAGISVEPILQIHDELVFEVAEEYKELLHAMVIEAMQDVWELAVPIIAEGGWATNWADL